jgi:hypothetical protein
MLGAMLILAKRRALDSSHLRENRTREAIADGSLLRHPNTRRKS